MSGTDPEPPASAITGSIRDDHRHISRVSQAIEASDDLAIARALLEEHRGMLAGHFAAEEAEDGLYEKILEIGPEHGHRLSLLRAQHRVLIERIDRALAQVAQNDAPADLHHQIRAIGRLLHSHEAAETDLLQEVFGADADPDG